MGRDLGDAHLRSLVESAFDGKDTEFQLCFSGDANDMLWKGQFKVGFLLVGGMLADEQRDLCMTKYCSRRFQGPQVHLISAR